MKFKYISNYLFFFWTEMHLSVSRCINISSSSFHSKSFFPNRKTWKRFSTGKPTEAPSTFVMKRERRLERREKKKTKRPKLFLISFFWKLFTRAWLATSTIFSLVCNISLQLLQMRLYKSQMSLQKLQVVFIAQVANENFHLQLFITVTICCCKRDCRSCKSYFCK